VSRFTQNFNELPHGPGVLVSLSTLRRRGIGAAGTTRQDAKGLPKEFTEAKKKKVNLEWNTLKAKLDGNIQANEGIKKGSRSPKTDQYTLPIVMFRPSDGFFKSAETNFVSSSWLIIAVRWDCFERWLFRRVKRLAPEC
jgi:hypothetical protein